MKIHTISSNSKLEVGCPYLESRASPFTIHYSLFLFSGSTFSSTSRDAYPLILFPLAPNPTPESYSMHISYFDESGDDGYPKTSSPLFVLSSIYTHHLNWKTNYELIRQFRRELAKSHGFLFDLELHTREFLTDKDPYRNLGYDPDVKKEILFLFCELFSKLNCRCVYVVIDKKAIGNRDYNVLEKAFTYSIQRIENDLKQDGSRFMIITDEGRAGKMRKTARKVQRINFIPSQFSNQSYRKEIQHLIEDPLPKNSKESYFIQFADLVAYLVNLWIGNELSLNNMPNRIACYLSIDEVCRCLEIIKSSLNTKASRSNEFGIVCYPKRT